MAHPLVWPGKYFFYPIGNTSAVCLTRDLPPEQSANILLLGCGDPRNVLYTIQSEPKPGESELRHLCSWPLIDLAVKRVLDFTCCDFEPGVLARNVLLFTMVADDRPYATIWKIFYHLYLDNDSHSILVEQCKKLVQLSDSLESWNNSPYGPFIKMCTAYTLAEMKRHWSLYAELKLLSSGRLKTIRNAFKSVFKSPANTFGTILSTARSTGPLLQQSSMVLTDQCKSYWKTGLTSSNPKDIAAATHINPTFAYSLEGEGCNVHYGTDPLSTFHLAPLFGNAKGKTSVNDAVKAAQSQFASWCSAFYDSLSAPTVPTVRILLGEATAVCRSLEAFSTTSVLNLGIPVAQWKTQTIQLNKDDYTHGGAPTSFNVIETSNLDDHIGLLNVLVATVPLLSDYTQSPTLYVESLLFGGKDATKEFTEHLHADVTIMGLLLGISPIDFLSGFTSRSNVHELLIHLATKGEGTQFHQVTTWKLAASGDSLVGRANQRPLPPSFDPRQLGTLLYDIYHDLFEHEDAQNFLRLNQENIMNGIRRSNIIHYIRESFVLFLKLVKKRIRVTDDNWVGVMERFLNAQQEDQSIKMDTLAYNDLCAHLYRHGVYTVPFFLMKSSKIGRFAPWENLTPIVRIILVVPREKLEVLEASNAGTPLLQCEVQGVNCMNVFTSIHVAFGRVIPMGSKANPRILFEEDPDGRRGSLPLVVSFVMPVWLLTDLEPMSALKVSLSVRSTTGTVSLIPKLGLNLHVFTAKFLDESHVHVLPEQPLPRREYSLHSVSKPLVSQIGASQVAHVELDEQCELVSSLTSRISVDYDGAKALLRSAAVPETVQISPCIMKVSIGNYAQNVVFPFPVIGSLHKLRVARKSLYIEVVVPVYGPFKSDGMTLNPFPVVISGTSITTWSIHRLNLSRLPVLELRGKALDPWLNTHVGAMMSSRERSLRKHATNSDILMAIKDTIHSVLVRSSGVQNGPAARLFAFRDTLTNNCDTIIFISDLRFDLDSHTIVCDGYVLPLTKSFIEKTSTAFHRLVTHGGLVTIGAREGEMRAWKLLLPALVERCRTWQHKENCEYIIQGKIPLAETMELDPLCSCGKGQDVDGMLKNGPLWKTWSPVSEGKVLFEGLSEKGLEES
ncbi:hypothetical protein H0H81_000728 [Sphagnurus paluster]|uniref:DUF4470 domain-containing protein n=1 Tax=Sphagnurus paluster TaxID=117069 RepID=A0A9P7K6W1_9AGAR|nr:hypothetical protein H0H81_000728 [Sphagnurus paluster]